MTNALASAPRSPATARRPVKLVEHPAFHSRRDARTDRTFRIVSLNAMAGRAAAQETSSTWTIATTAGLQVACR